MNDMIRGGLLFLAGAVVGAAGASLMARQDNPLRGAVVGTLAQGLAAKDKMLTSLEKAKENVEDMVAEARQAKPTPTGLPDQSK
ncbi:DUF1490 family protein [Desulfonatronum thioautotrophicum]|uniref:DUF1490 family protein n=1 Tax=Desulfonatronum thioautotrophicum TaxID=617001 RepID=UPI0005EAE2E5|nr:DUF1490 family protein [Desulfonatronum thioautotrophicum]